MIDIGQLGWRADTIGELDHRLLKAPSVKLRSVRQCPGGGSIYCVDLRVRCPNADNYLSTTELHSLEHFLLEGLQRYLSKHFVSIGIMGCRTGFYLVLANEGRAEKICAVLELIFNEMQDATAVPYARIDQCGHYRDHSLERARTIAREILTRRVDWLNAI